MQEELADLRKQSGLWEIEEKNWKEKSVRWQEEKEKAPRLQSSQSVSSSQGMQDKMARLEQDNSSLKNEISQL